MMCSSAILSSTTTTQSSSGGRVDTYESGPYSSFEAYPQDQDPASTEDEMIDSEDEPVNNNNMLNNNMLNNDMFIALENSHSNPDCDNIGPNTCDNRDLCQWTCKTRYNSDRYRGCCKRNQIRRPTPNPTRRPTPTPTNSGGSGTSFDDGLATGRAVAESLWRAAGSSCSSVWGEFQDSVDRKVRTKGWDATGNWRTKSFNRGARAGMNEVVVEKEMLCFRDTADECVDLGNEAARIIAYDHCNRFRVTNQRKQWRRDCRDVAVAQCGGQVFDQVRNECGSPTPSELKSLQNKCRSQVLTMIGDRS